MVIVSQGRYIQNLYILIKWYVINMGMIDIDKFEYESEFFKIDSVEQTFYEMQNLLSILSKD